MQIKKMFSKAENLSGDGIKFSNLKLENLGDLCRQIVSCSFANSLDCSGPTSGRILQRTGAEGRLGRTGS